MRIMTSYKVKIKHYNHIFRDTVEQYRRAVRFFLEVCDARWAELSALTGKGRNNRMERLTIQTAKNSSPEYNFSQEFYKFPCYLRRAAIQEALGLYSGYREKLEAWEKNPAGRKPSMCRAGGMMPAMYRDNMYVRTGAYTAKVKVYIRNTWDWLEVDLRKSDVDYISRHCAGRKECVPTLRKSGKQWFLAFGFQEEQALHTKPAWEQRILSVDVGLNNACTVTAMEADGTVTGRAFLSLPGEEDSLSHAVNRIKKAQHHGAHKTRKRDQPAYLGGDGRVYHGKGCGVPGRYHRVRAPGGRRQEAREQTPAHPLMEVPGSPGHRGREGPQARPAGVPGECMGDQPSGL